MCVYDVIADSCHISFSGYRLHEHVDSIPHSVGEQHGVSGEDIPVHRHRI